MRRRDLGFAAPTDEQVAEALEIVDRFEATAAAHRPGMNGWKGHQVAALARGFGDRRAAMLLIYIAADECLQYIEKVFDSPSDDVGRLALAFLLSRLRTIQLDTLRMGRCEKAEGLKLGFGLACEEIDEGWGYPAPEKACDIGRTLAQYAGDTARTLEHREVRAEMSNERRRSHDVTTRASSILTGRLREAQARRDR